MLSNNNIKIFSNQGIILLIILIICFFSYYQIVNYEFIRWDDDVQITENSNVKNLNWESITHNLNKERFTFLTLTTYSAIYKVWGNNPAPFHWLSIILHLLNVILVFQLIKQFSKNIYTIGFVVLLFALHPMRVESVAWISELKDLLFTFFSLSAFLFYIKYLRNNSKYYFFVLAAIMAILASFSKIQGLIAPVSFYLFDIFYKRKFSLVLILEKVILTLLIFLIFNWIIIGMIVIILAFQLYYRNKVFEISNVLKFILIGTAVLLVLTYLIHIFYVDKTGLWAKVPETRNTFLFAERFLLAGYALWFYFIQFFLPFSQNAVHPYPIRLSQGEFPTEYYFTLIVLLVVICVSVFLIFKRKKIPDLLFFGWFFFLVNISMVLHIIPIEGRLVVADRYSYLAYFGLFISVASIGENYFFQKQKFERIIQMCFVILLCACSILTYYRCKVWENTKSLFSDVLQKNPQIAFAHLNMAATYMKNQMPDSALIYFNQSIKLDSLDPTAYFNRAFAFIDKNENENALNDFVSVLRLSKNNRYMAMANTSIGVIFEKKGNDSLAMYYYNLSIKQDSILAIAYNNRGMYFLNKNKVSEAHNDFNKAITIDKDYTEAINNLGWILIIEGKSGEAQKYFDRSIELNPKYSFAYDNRGYLKYINGDAAGAIEDFNESISLNPTLYQAYINRGRAFAYLKEFKNAITDFSIVLKNKPNNMAALTNRAYAWFYSNEINKAESDFKFLTSFYPTNAIAWQNLAWFHTQVKDYKSAINEFEKSIELDKTLINSFINLGWIYTELNDFNKADIFFKLSLDLNPNSPEALYLLGELNRKKGNKESACKYYQSASNFGSIPAKNAMNLYCKNNN
jgi:protein O-mannosyl-transferase